MELTIQSCDGYSRSLLESNVDLLSLHACNSERYPYLLESHRYTNENSRFDILFAFPGEKIESSGFQQDDFFQRFDAQFLADCHHSKNNSELPFRGGWFLFLSYELIAAIESKLSEIAVDTRLPLASATRIPAAVIKDHKERKTWLVCEAGSEHLLAQINADIQNLTDLSFNKLQVDLTEDDPQSFKLGVDKILDYLKEGDTLQVNLSRQWNGELKGNTNYLDIYQSLKKNNPSPFSGLACLNDQVICSSSPERLVRCKSGRIDMRPIAGTRPRSENTEIDDAFSAQLLADSKENAEHIMLLDLIRNDLGRVCKAGSIGVDETRVLESYATVHHIVSNVSGEMLDQLTPADVIKAVFPGGTITGCPKVRCMEIINELENTPRGAYTGSMGYVNRNGDMDLNILIRSMVVNKDTLSFRTGAGIVADSDPARELEETRHKAAALIKALES